MNKLLSSLALAAAAVAAAPAQAAPVVTFSASSYQVAVGDVVTVDLSISGLGAEILSAFDINMLYDGSVMTNASVTHSVFAGAFGPFLEQDQASTSFDFGNTGVIDYSLSDDATLAAQQADDFLMLRFAFTADADGFSFIGLGGDLDFERNFVGLNFASLDVEVNGICIGVGTGTCNAVPEPASFGLAALGLVGAFMPAALRRRRPGLAR